MAWQMAVARCPPRPPSARTARASAGSWLVRRHCRELCVKIWIASQPSVDARASDRVRDRRLPPRRARRRASAAYDTGADGCPGPLLPLADRATSTSAASAPRSTTGCSPATHGGVAVLRIEDTDQSRETAGAIEQIQELAGLARARLRRVAGAAAARSARTCRASGSDATARSSTGWSPTGRAYPCFQTPEELEAARATARETDDPASPTRAHRDLTARAGRREFEAAGRQPVIRFRTPLDGATEIDDLVRGAVRWEHRLLGDHVLLRADGVADVPAREPASTTCDHGMTHVIRGDDLLSSTPRQKLLRRGARRHAYPVTAHLPMILGAGQEAALEAARRGVGGGVPRRRLPARGGRQLPRAGRLELRRLDRDHDDAPSWSSGSRSSASTRRPACSTTRSWRG